MLSRRAFLRGLGAALLAGATLGGYAVAGEPFRLRVKNYVVTLPRWPSRLRVKVAALADTHACLPWMSADRLRYIAERTNALGTDVIVLLGDYVAGHRFLSDHVPSADWSAAMGQLSAPLGVHAILGNHDWWEDPVAQRRGYGPVFGRVALEDVGIPVYENDVARLEKNGEPFWLVGLGDQLALLPYQRYGRRRWGGMDDLDGALAKLSDDAPAILLAHEPDIFPRVPDRISLTLAGHTHGGQLRFFGYSPIVPSRFGNRYAYGHVVELPNHIESPRRAAETPRHMIVSGGLGCSIAPVRFGMPPEIVLVELGG